MQRILTVLALTLSLPLTGCATSEVPPLAIGDKVNLAGLQDQNENTFTHQNKMQALLFVDGMAGKDLIQNALNTIDTQCMDEGKLVYLADISAMPGLISKFIAVPKMRDYGYPVWLDRDGAASSALPVREDQVTLLSIDDQLISGEEFFASSEALTQRLAKMCGVAK
ncbi:hypothetical protein [Vibrio sp. ABG19]|uniref:hypothetical protein n=1 Tax=Vibrio sp. ABG19 TaxID=2817385 RepID=UPI00249EA5CB|nr:hypothetical protein [Vibrio sp. ABG19]WGY47116.1 hypothetical protein J0X00_20325 [Vibrio sp. ABG19]